jgi:hypothetical protein
MAETADVVIQGLRSHTANWDRALDKYNYYLSGEEARYSPLENRIYVVDSHLEKYASNPNYPQEMLTEVPYHLWNKLPHEILNFWKSGLFSPRLSPFRGPI